MLVETDTDSALVHWLIDYPNAKGDGQTYFAVVLSDGTIVPPQVVQLK